MFDMNDHSTSNNTILQSNTSNNTTAASKDRSSTYNTLKPTKQTLFHTSYHTYTTDELHELDEPISYPIFHIVWLNGSTIYISGGGGRAGTGINSGITVCQCIIGTSIDSPTYTQYVNTNNNNNNCIDTINIDKIGVLPVSFVDTGAENLVFHSTLCPVNANELIIACSNTMCILDIQYDYLVKNSIQTDYHVNQDNDMNCNMLNVFSSDGRYLVTGGEDCIIQLWNYATLKHISHTRSMIHKHSITSLSIDCTNKLICSTGGDINLHVYRIPQSSSELRPLYTIQHTLNNDKKQCIYRSAQFINNPSTQTSDILCIVNCTVRGPSYLMKYRPCNTGEYILTKSQYINKSSALQLSVTNDYKLAAVATSDGSVYIYDINTLKCVTYRLHIHELPITGLTFSPDHKLLVSAAADKTIQFTKTCTITWWNKLIKSVVPTIIMSLFIVLLVTLFFELQPHLLQHDSIKSYITQHQPIHTWINNTRFTFTHLGDELPHIKHNIVYYTQLITDYTVYMYHTIPSHILPYIQQLNKYLTHQFHLFVTNQHIVLRYTEQHLSSTFEKLRETAVYHNMVQQVNDIWYHHQHI